MAEVTPKMVPSTLVSPGCPAVIVLGLLLLYAAVDLFMDVVLAVIS